MMKFLFKTIMVLLIAGPSFADNSDLISLGLALRDKFYPHLNSKEVKLILRHSGRPDDQFFIFAKYRISSKNYSEIEEIESIASIVLNRASLGLVDENNMEKAQWLDHNYHRIVCENTLRLAK